MMHYYNTFGLLDFFLEILLILLVVGIVIFFLNKSGFAGSDNNEKLVSMEKDVAEIKKTVEEIKEKLEEI
ncbi:MULTISPECIES: hypothetical protein [Methanococcoides]|uniref:hypothetical protein n=1 Tax=Methanococcoides TaxID=2225 RepID=UPI00064F08E3|nr:MULTISPECIES: hypothetical protein [Methanococcoides]UGV40766.1 hypothetical protein J7W08_12095 [Methanococcoides orientis]